MFKADVTHQIDFEAATAELNQIFEWERFAVVAGARAQSGEFTTRSLLENPSRLAGLFSTPVAQAKITEDFRRVTGYGYFTLKPVDSLQLTAGLAYDDITFPENFRNPPISAGQESRSQFSPKGAVVWTPLTSLTLRGIYAKSLGGATLDESYRLEPAQLAGFPQAFRSLISESVAGSVTAPGFEISGLALDYKLGGRTFLGFTAENLESEVRRTVGFLTLHNSMRPIIDRPTREHLDYRERSFNLSVSRLIGDEWALGARYGLTRAELHTVWPGVPAAAVPDADRFEQTDLHHASLFVVFNHSSGFFARGETDWYRQGNPSLGSAVPGDDVFQHHFFLGYRFLHRRAEAMFGILNLTDQDYRLSPLTLHSELPRTRVFTARLRFSF